MTNEQIAKFLEPSHLTKNSVKIEFKTRQSITGLFIKAPDYNELKSKNFWRIVTGTYIAQWESSKDNNLARYSMAGNLCGCLPFNSQCSAFGGLSF